ncbi:MAG TPA: UDP-N-acetylmuramate--L-alanine ligase [Gemmatimonadales bacterium]|nr:UDP-N-acetylmuramate--L-alanine ligase [Gemmatimonadales bacterium]
MDLFDPADPRPVHFMGVGGAGMSALALVARRRGVAVSGCDPDPSGASDVAALGAQIFTGHDPSHISGARAVVVSAAVPPEHPELVRARAAGVPVVQRKQALAQLVKPGRLVAVAGTHGKSTTTVMTTEALRAAGLEPTGLVGGRVPDWGGNARLGDDRLFVVEADEYDQAFLTLEPAVAIVNNIEADHLECYGSLEALEQAFATFSERATRVIVSGDDPGAARLATRLGSRAWRFGVGPGDFEISDVHRDPAGSQARVRLPDGRRVTLRLAVPGLHNIRNATGALGAVVALDAAVEPALEALAAYRGLGRRFERLGEVRGIEFVDDYAHHPSEIVATLAAARQAFPGRRLIAVFQPHLFSRTAAHGAAMGRALQAADVAIVTEIYPAREQPLPGVSGRSVAAAAEAGGRTVIFEPDKTRLRDRILEAARPGDVVLTLGAGDVTRVGRELVQWLLAA